MIDVLFVNPLIGSRSYQALAENYSAIEPPTWSLLLAESCRVKNFTVGILDCDAEKLSDDDVINRIDNLKPRLILFVVYGQNPNSGTVNMSGAIQLANVIKKSNFEQIISFVGSHSSALPMEVLENKSIDIVFLNEGVYALHNLLMTNLKDNLHKIKGIGFKKESSSGEIFLLMNPPQHVVPQSRMDIDMPGYAWDLLPYKTKPLDLYRAHFWHANFTHSERTPFAAIYTSLGCSFGCDFCMINIVNRINNNEDISAADSKGMRFWSPEWVHKEINKLVNLGVKTLRISDEMFFLNKKYYQPILQNIIDMKYELNMWAYSRVDSVNKNALELFKKAGVNWLALGVEAGNQIVRQETSKGSFKEVNIRDVCNNVNDHDIKIISNYIFGFPTDTMETMQETLDLSLELNTEMANMYPCQALPGSPLFIEAKKKGWDLPKTYEEYGFLSYEAKPLPTNTLKPEEVLKFRDEAWNKYFTNPKYLDLVKKTFGEEQKNNVIDMAKIKLKRKILGD